MTAFRFCKPSEMSRANFLEAFGDIYEHSPWVAETVFEQGIGPQDDQIENLHQRMAAALDEADFQAQLDLINAHPDLAGRAAINGELTKASTKEQSGAGIDQCTPEEFDKFTTYNDRYKAKFNFPFIMAVKGANRHQILAAFETRLNNDRDTEFATAINEINKIAFLRLWDL